MGLLQSENPEAAARLQRIRNIAARCLQGEIEYSEACASINGLSRGEIDKPRKAKTGSDRKAKGGQDRSED